MQTEANNHVCVCALRKSAFYGHQISLRSVLGATQFSLSLPLTLAISTACLNRPKKHTPNSLHHSLISVYVHYISRTIQIDSIYAHLDYTND